MMQNSNGALRSINSSRMTVDPEGTLWFSNVTREDTSDDFVYACSATSLFRYAPHFFYFTYFFLHKTAPPLKEAIANGLEHREPDDIPAWEVKSDDVVFYFFLSFLKKKRKKGNARQSVLLQSVDAIGSWT